MIDERVQQSELGRLGDTVGDGGQGTVFRLDEYDVPGELGPFLAKIYADDVVVAPQGLTALVRFRQHQLDETSKQALLAVAAWPLQVIEHQGRTRGIVMKAAPASFRHSVQAPRGTRECLREAQWLFTSDTKAAQFGVQNVTDEQRRVLCVRLAEALQILHGNGTVYGDLSARNVLWTVEPEPRVFLLDCDGARRVGSAAPLRQLDSPDWGDPANPSHQCLESDRHKYGLFVARVFSRSLTGTDLSAARRVLGKVGSALLMQTLDSDDPALRPSLEDWLTYFATGEPPDQEATGADAGPRQQSWVKVDDEWVRASAAEAPSAPASAPTTPAMNEPVDRERWVRRNGTWVRIADDTSRG